MKKLVLKILIIASPLLAITLPTNAAPEPLNCTRLTGPALDLCQRIQNRSQKVCEMVQWGHWHGAQQVPDATTVLKCKQLARSLGATHAFLACLEPDGSWDTSDPHAGIDTAPNTLIPEFRDIKPVNNNCGWKQDYGRSPNDRS